MNRFIAFCFVVFAVVTSACAVESGTAMPTGVAVIPPNDLVATTSPTSVGRITLPPPPDVPTLLTVVNYGPPLTTVTKKSRAIALSLDFMTGDEQLEIKGLHVALEALTPGCVLRGSGKGNPYISQLQLTFFGEDIGWSADPAKIFPKMAKTGELGFTTYGFTIPAHATFRVNVMASLASAEEAPGEFYGCNYRATLKPFEAGDVRITALGSTTSRAVSLSQIHPQTDIVGNIVRVVEMGELSIVEWNQPGPQNVLAGSDSMYVAAQYKATAKYEAIEINRLVVTAASSLPWDVADYTAVAIARDGKLHALLSSPSGSTATVEADLSMDPIIVPKDGEVVFQILAKYAPVTAWSKSPAKTGLARSGHAPALGLASGFLTSEWSTSYTGKLNVRTVGETSGERIYVTAGAKMGNPMVLRKSQPIIKILPLAKTTLEEGVDQDLIQIEVCAADGNPIAVKNLGFRTKKPFDVKVSNDPDRNWHLRRDTTDFDEATVRPFVPFDSTEQVFIFKFLGNYEEVISTCKKYAFHAPVTGLKIGSTVSTSVDLRVSDKKIVTGSISEASATEPWYVEGGPVLLDGFVWSDMSAEPHNVKSADWTTSDFIISSPGSQELTK